MALILRIRHVSTWLQRSMATVHAAFLRQAWPSYLLVLLLELKLLWRMWDLKDITAGDTAGYFVTAGYWLDSFRVNIAWSPLYTAFYGSFLFITRDPYAATILHRLALILLITVLVLFLLRSFLSPGLALLGTVWWAVVPTYYNNLYEVHLFALLPVLLGWILILRWNSPWARGTAVAVLAAATILVRNEFGIAAALTAALCLFYEYYQTGRNGSTKRTILAYGVPLACAVLLCVVAYWRSVAHFPELSTVFQDKHTLNMCQIYAFGFQQRNSAWGGNPWLHCQTLMQETFGKGLPSFAEMLAANPAAVIEHFLWNLSLIPNGLELLLFGAMSGRVNPDYVSAERAYYPLFLLPILIVVPLAAVWQARHDFYRRSAEWFRNRMRFAIAFVPMLAVALIVALVQRPRPSYLLYVTIVVIVLFMESVSALVRERPTWGRAIEIVAPLAALLLILGLPSYYVEYSSGRPLKDNIERLAPQREVLVAAEGRLFLSEYGTDAAWYLDLRRTTADPLHARPAVLDSRDLQRWDRSIPLEQWLANEQIQFVFFDPAILRQLQQTPSAMALLNDPASKGWKSIAYEHQSDKAWIFLAKAEPEWTDGAYPSELFRGVRFQWLRRSVHLKFPPGTECVAFRIFGTGRRDLSQTVRVTGNNIQPIHLNLAGTSLVNQLDIHIPIINPSQGDHLSLEADISEVTPGGDPRSFALGATVPKRKSHSDCRSNPIISRATPYTLGDTIDFTVKGNAAAYLVGGWAQSEAWGTWTDGDMAILRLAPPPWPKGDLFLSIRALGLIGAQLPRQEVDVLVNGRPAGSWVFDSAGMADRELRIAADLVGNGETIEIAFATKTARSPAELGISADTRRLGIGIAAARLGVAQTPVPAPDPIVSRAAPYTLGDTIDFTAKGNAALYLVGGFAQSEAWGTWTDGEVATLRVAPTMERKTDLVLMVRAQPFITPQNPRQEVDVLVNGRLAGTWSFDSFSMADRTLSLPADLVRDFQTLEIAFITQTARSPAELGLSSDARRLGIGIAEASLRVAQAPSPIR